MQKLHELIIPIRTVSELNSREHWTAKHKRAKKQKSAVKNKFFLLKIDKVDTVRLTRFGKRLLDDDNLQASFKAIRDQIADCLHPGLAPGQADKFFNWQYAQEIAKNYSIRIELYSSIYSSQEWITAH